MSLNPEGLRLYHDRLAAMIAAVRDLPQPLVKGRACALGTLNSSGMSLTAGSHHICFRTKVCFWRLAAA